VLHFLIFAALKKPNMKYLSTLLIVLFILSCNDNDKTGDTDPTIVPPASGIPAPVNITYNIIAQHPHDTSSYTQGLELHKGKMYESAGDYKNSSLRITDYKTGKVEKIHPMGTDKIFAEGITIFNNKIYQLTWQNHIVYVYDLSDITKPIKTFNWPYEGWGITNNGKELIISDGTANLYFVDAESFKVRTTVSVQTNQGSIDNLNELEYIDGFVYANIYNEFSIAKIDPETGHVVGLMNFPDLPPNEKTGRTEQFNGIAYDTASKTIFVTGKRWPKLFEVKLN
jgi:glutaminyl-peptide cyclotransferase